MTWKKDLKSICFWNELVFIYKLVCISLNFYKKNSESVWNRIIFFDAKFFYKKHTDGKCLEKSAVCTDISLKNQSVSLDVQIFSFAISVFIFDFYFSLLLYIAWLTACLDICILTALVCCVYFGENYYFINLATM